MLDNFCRNNDIKEAVGGYNQPRIIIDAKIEIGYCRRSLLGGIPTVTRRFNTYHKKTETMQGPGKRAISTA
jgi:hypothetical protein